MKVLTSTAMQAFLLILVLSYYARSLFNDAVTLRRVENKQAIMMYAQSHLMYDQPSGIDIYGTRILPSSLHAKGYIVFLLREKSLQKDLSFWNQFEALLGTREAIGLIGYCDSEQCVDSIRKIHPLAFPILASGEATGIEAIVDADMDGNALLKETGSHKQSTISWRSADSSPQQAAQKALR